MSAKAPRALVYVQHLLGIGHLRRAAALARALDAQGFEVVLVSGGMPTDGLDIGAANLVQLPPLRSADESFSGLVDAQGRPASHDTMRARSAQLLRTLETFRPDVLVTETFPFGRSQLRAELLPLVETARSMAPRPLIVSSIRDVLQQKRKPERIQESLELARRSFDRILVHGDPRLVRLEDSFPPAEQIADKIVYTGFIVESASPRIVGTSPSPGEVVVSAGGGAVGAALLDAALRARRLSSAAERPWRLLAGHNLPVTVFDQLRTDAPHGVIVERARPDFRALLRIARASISQAGYNTVMDLLCAGTPCVLVPFAAGEQTEQAFRAQRLEALGLAVVLAEADLTPENLAQALERSLALPKGGATFDMDGARASARLISAWLDGHGDHEVSAQ